MLRRLFLRRRKKTLPRLRLDFDLVKKRWKFVPVWN
jgi:hypothetical protein